MSAESNHYPGFEYKASDLSAFVLSVGTFIISLKSGEMVTFIPTDIIGFKEWLYKHRVRDISVDDGISIQDRMHLPQKKVKRK